MPDGLWFICAAMIPRGSADLDGNRGRLPRLLTSLVVGTAAVVILGVVTFFPSAG